MALPISPLSRNAQATLDRLLADAVLVDELEEIGPAETPDHWVERTAFLPSLGVCPGNLGLDPQVSGRSELLQVTDLVLLSGVESTADVASWWRMDLIHRLLLTLRGDDPGSYWQLRDVEGALLTDGLTRVLSIERPFALRTGLTGIRTDIRVAWRAYLTEDLDFEE